MRLRIFYRWRGWRAFLRELRDLPPLIDVIAPEDDAVTRRRLTALTESSPTRKAVTR